MAEWYDRIRGRYQTAMGRPNRDLAMILAGIPAQPAPPPPNYAAIPLNMMQPGGEPQPAPPPQMPPAMNLGPMPPMNADAQQADDAARYRPQPSPAQQPMPVAPPVTVQAPPMDPRTMGDADMAGYGGSPRIPGIAAPQPYSHLNPTPSLEEIFRREYAANPMAFGGKFG